MEVTRLKLGRRVFEFYKHKCSVCGKPFPSGGAKRVTCGQPACQKRRFIEITLARRRKVFKTKRLKCPYCLEFFTIMASPDNRRVTCGLTKCRIEHNLAIQKQAQEDPAFKEKQRAYNKAYHGVFRDMLKELKRLSGVKSGPGRPSLVRLMHQELEHLAFQESR